MKANVGTESYEKIAKVAQIAFRREVHLERVNGEVMLVLGNPL